MGFSLPATELEATLGVLAVKMPSMNVQLVMLSRLIRLVHQKVCGMHCWQCIHDRIMRFYHQN